MSKRFDSNIRLPSDWPKLHYSIFDFLVSIADGGGGGSLFLFLVFYILL